MTTPHQAAEDDVLRRFYALLATGLTLTTAARAVGRSQSWAYKHRPRVRLHAVATDPGPQLRAVPRRR